MNRQTALILNEMNSHFYAAVAHTFSSTRQSSWPSWEHVADALEACLTPEHVANSCIKSLDFACGNLRFQKFLLERFPGHSFCFDTVDNCQNLGEEGFASAVKEQAELSFCCADIVAALANKQWPELPFDDKHQLISAFGFMHHIPSYELRLQFVKQLVEYGQEGSLIALSFWRFLTDEKLAAKAKESHKQALAYLQQNKNTQTVETEATDSLGATTLETPEPNVLQYDDSQPDVSQLDALQLNTSQLTLSQLDISQLDDNDYFLGWQEERGVFRYCHHFTEEELVQLCTDLQQYRNKKGLGFRLYASFDADGRNEMLNRVLIFRIVAS